MNWSHRLYQAKNRRYFIGAASLIMPYNYQNVVQHYRPKTKDLKIVNFYASDMYMLDGSLPIHKFKTNPMQLEMMLD